MTLDPSSDGRLHDLKTASPADTSDTRVMLMLASYPPDKIHVKFTEPFFWDIYIEIGAHLTQLDSNSSIWFLLDKIITVQLDRFDLLMTGGSQSHTDEYCRFGDMLSSHQTLLNLTPGAFKSRIFT